MPTGNKIDVDSPPTSPLRTTMRKIVALMAACILAVSLAACDGANKKINAPVESSEVSSSNYQDMVSQFKGAGFTNVSTREIDDLILGWLTDLTRDSLVGSGF